CSLCLFNQNSVNEKRSENRVGSADALSLPDLKDGVSRARWMKGTLTELGAQPDPEVKPESGAK
ncbi:MAG: hypothetical protein WBL07_13985, partial [Thiothrix litoralis]|uniref:hypothetical protein n=1 Tax=Thiothrix litoralis TaxID=2891210 RepID=UPI003C74DBDD